MTECASTRTAGSLSSSGAADRALRNGAHALVFHRVCQVASDVGATCVPWEVGRENTEEPRCNVLEQAFGVAHEDGRWRNRAAVESGECDLREGSRLRRGAVGFLAGRECGSGTEAAGGPGSTRSVLEPAEGNAAGGQWIGVCVCAENRGCWARQSSSRCSRVLWRPC